MHAMRLLGASAMTLGLFGCGAMLERRDMPRSPYCVLGGTAPVDISQEDYGTTYTPGLEPGPAAAVPESRVVVATDAVRCVPPPWWEPRAIRASPPPRAASAAPRARTRAASGP